MVEWNHMTKSGEGERRVKTVGRYLKPYVGRMCVGMAMKFIAAELELLLPMLLADVIDKVVPTGDVGRIYLYGGVMAGCALAVVVFNIVANRMAAWVSMQVTRTLRGDLFARVETLSCAQSDRYSDSSLISRITNDTYNVHQLFDRMQRGGVRAPMLVLGGIVLTFLLEPVLAGVQLVISVLTAGVVLAVTRAGIPLYDKVQTRVDGLVRVIRENASGVRVVKALSRQGYERRRFGGINDGLRDAEQRAGLTVAVSSPVIGVLLNLGLTLVILIGARRVQAGVMPAGQILAFLSYFTIILTATLSVTKVFLSWSRGSASAARIEEILLLPREQPLVKTAAAPADGLLSFDHVSFSYRGRERDLEDLSFTLRRGGALGIMGPTGSGKTTAVALMLRLYDPDEGVVRLNGVDLRSLPEEQLKKTFGAVQQSASLISGTVYENISYRRDLPMEQVERAARAAQAEEFISGLPGGYACAVDIRGMNLSGGQRQRLLVARALAGQPEILLLDSADSALDYRTAALLHAAVRREYPGTTMVMVSERVSTLRACDEILVLCDGRVEARGSHDALMACCARYREAARAQMGGAV